MGGSASVNDVQYPLMKPRLPAAEEVLPLLKEMDRSRIYSNGGPLVRQLQDLYAEFLGVDPNKVVALGNATLGIQGCLETSQIESWVVPTYTFAATGLAALQAHVGLTLADIESDHSWMDPSLILTGPETGVVPVAPFGAAIEFEPWTPFRNVVIDAAASLGTMPDLGCLPKDWVVVFSLHATKVLPAGEGALVVCGSSTRAADLRAWANFGFRGSRISERRATNAKMSEVAAAYALASLSSWDTERAEWLSSLALSRDPELLKSQATNVASSTEAHPYWIADFGSASGRIAARSALSAAGVETREWWPEPLHAMPAFAGVPLLGSGLVAESTASRLLGLPMYRELEQDVVSVVSQALCSD